MEEQIDRLFTLISRLSERIDNLERDLRDLQYNEVSQVKSDIYSLEGQVGNLDREVSALRYR